MTNPAAQLRLFRSGQGSGPRYGSLLLILVVTYLLSAFTSGRLVNTVQVALFLAVVLIALRNGRFHRKTVRILAVGVLLGSGVSVILRLVNPNGGGGALASLWTALILLLAVFLIVRQVVYQPQITGQSIYGVLSAYMIIGLIFSAVYVAMWKFGGAFFVARDGGHHPDVPVLQLHHADHAGVRGLHGGRGRWPGGGRARGHSRPDVPGHPGGPAGRGVPLVGPGGCPAGQPASGSGRGPRSAGQQHGARFRPRRLRLRCAAPAARIPRGGLRPRRLRLQCAAPAARIPRRGPGRFQAKKASAPGLIRLSPPGAVRGRGTGPRPGGERGPGVQARSPPPAPRSGIEPGGPEHRVRSGTQGCPGQTSFISPPCMARA